MRKTSSLHVFKELFITELLIFKQIFFDKLINLCIWMTSTTIVMSYIMPSFGVSQNYGPFMFAGVCASAGLFEVFPSVVNFISDIEGDRVIDYYCTLPMPSWLIILVKMAYCTFNSMVLGLCILPIGKILLWNQLSLSAIHIPHFIVIFLVSNMFYGAFTLWVASRVYHMPKIGNVWMRFVFPLWYLGGFQFSWKVLYGISPTLAYINLLNPIAYIMEGVRGALLGSGDYIPFWICVLVISCFAAIACYLAIKRMQKRLDFV